MQTSAQSTELNLLKNLTEIGKKWLGLFEITSTIMGHLCKRLKVEQNRIEIVFIENLVENMFNIRIYLFNLHFP